MPCLVSAGATTQPTIDWHLTPKHLQTLKESIVDTAIGIDLWRTEHRLGATTGGAGFGDRLWADGRDQHGTWRVDDAGCLHNLCGAKCL